MVCKISGTVLPIKRGEYESVIKFDALIAGNKKNYEYQLFLSVNKRTDILLAPRIEAEIYEAGWDNLANKFKISFGKRYILLVDKDAAIEMALTVLSKKDTLKKNAIQVMNMLSEELKGVEITLLLNPSRKPEDASDVLANTDIRVILQTI